MAKARISDKGNRVLISLDFDEAAVLYTMLAYAPTTESRPGSLYAYHSEGPFRALQEIRECLGDQGLWPDDTEAEAEKEVSEEE